MEPYSIDYSSSGSRISSLNAFSSYNSVLASAQKYLSSTTPAYVQVIELAVVMILVMVLL